MQLMRHCLIPDWPAPPNVKALQTTRQGGFSLPPYQSLNLGDHVNDPPHTVSRNRQQLSQLLPSEPLWLKQTHSTTVVRADQAGCHPKADASFATRPGAVCCVMTADCLPVLFCDHQGTRIAAAHAGWKGLANGILEQSIQQLGLPASELMAWLGPAISQPCFEVGNEVRQCFIAHDAAAEQAFQAGNSPNKWQADLYLLARQRLQRAGIHAIYGDSDCTYRQPERYFSYRRDGVTGRMASLIWLTECLS